MSLFFDNVTLLTYIHTPIFLENGYRYKLQKTFTIQGVLTALGNTDGIKPVWTKALLVQAQAEDYQDLLLNGISFGQGKVLNVSFEPGDNVKQQKYTCAIQAYSAPAVTPSALGDEFDGIDLSVAHCIDRIDESFSYNTNDANDIGYEHSLSIRFNRNPESLGTDPIAYAKTLAHNFMANANLQGFLGEYDNPARKLYTEVYNKVDFSCSFTERANVKNDDHSDHSFTYTHNLQVAENGIVTVSEHGEIQANIQPLGGKAWEGFEHDIPNVLTRVLEIFNAHNFSTLDLHEFPIQKQIVRDKFAGTVTYDYTFTNDPRINELAIWEYTISVNRSQEGEFEVSENGSVRGLGRPNGDRYQHALEFYDTVVAPDIFTRIDAAYVEAGGSHTLRLTKIGSSKAEYVGEITYGQTWTDSSLYDTSSPIRRQEIEVVTEYPVHLVVNTNVINVKQVIQPQNTSTVGQRTVQIKLKGARDTNIDAYLAYAKDIILDNDYNDIGSDTYISSARYSISPNSNEFSLSVGWAFHGFYKVFQDLILT